MDELDIVKRKLEESYEGVGHVHDMAEQFERDKRNSEKQPSLTRPRIRDFVRDNLHEKKREQTELEKQLLEIQKERRDRSSIKGKKKQQLTNEEREEMIKKFFHKTQGLTALGGKKSKRRKSKRRKSKRRKSKQRKFSKKR